MRNNFPSIIIPHQKHVWSAYLSSSCVSYRNTSSPSSGKFNSRKYVVLPVNVNTSQNMCCFFAETLSDSSQASNTTCWQIYEVWKTMILTVESFFINIERLFLTPTMARAVNNAEMFTSSSDGKKHLSFCISGMFMIAQALTSFFLNTMFRQDFVRREMR